MNCTIWNRIGSARTLPALALASAMLAGGTARAGADDLREALSLVGAGETVVAAAKRPQPVSETSSLVTVISRAEIEALGYHSLADALRWVRGMFVTDDRNYSYLGVRGLERPGDYNNKVLLTFDGHTMNGVVFGDALLGDELGLDLEAVERIEIVRGPGSALYGGHAVLAVVNVVMRHGRSAPAASVAARAGAGRERRGFASFSGTHASGVEWLVSGSWQAARGLDWYFPAYDSPATGNGRAVGADGEQAYAAYGTLEWRRSRLAVKLNDRMKRVPTAEFGTVFGDRRTRTWDGHDFVELSTTQPWGRAVELNARAYWDGARYHGVYVYDYGQGPVENIDTGNGDTFGTEWRVNWSASRSHLVTAGTEAQSWVRLGLENHDLDPYRLYFDRRWHGQVEAVYAQDEWRPTRTLIVTGGARVDRDTRFGAITSPRLDAVWRLAPGTSAKLLAGTAFRGPTHYEDDSAAVRLDPERVRTYEAAVERAWTRTAATLSVYHTELRNRIDLVDVDSQGNSYYRNRGAVDSRGIEGELRLSTSHGMRARAALAYQRSTEAGADVTNSPRWNGHVLVAHAPEGARFTLAGGVRWLSSRLTRAGERTGGAAIVDARAGAHLGPRAVLGFEARNLFDAHAYDPASDALAADRLELEPRALFLTLSWRREPLP